MSIYIKKTEEKRRIFVNIHKKNPPGKRRNLCQSTHKKKKNQERGGTVPLICILLKQFFKFHVDSYVCFLDCIFWGCRTRPSWSLWEGTTP